MTGDERLLNAIRALNAGSDLVRSARMVLAEQAASLSVEATDCAQARPLPSARPENQPLLARFIEQAHAQGIPLRRPAAGPRFRLALATATMLFAVLLLSHSVRLAVPAAERASLPAHPMAPPDALPSLAAAQPIAASPGRPSAEPHSKPVRARAETACPAPDTQRAMSDAFAPYRVKLFRAPDPQLLRVASVRLGAPPAAFHFNRETAAFGERSSLAALPYPKFPGYPQELAATFTLQKEDSLAQR